MQPEQETGKGLRGESCGGKAVSPLSAGRARAAEAGGLRGLLGLFI